MKSVIIANGAKSRGTKTPVCFAPLHRSSLQHLIPKESAMLHISLLKHSLVIIFSATVTEKDNKHDLAKYAVRKCKH